MSLSNWNYWFSSYNFNFVSLIKKKYFSGRLCEITTTPTSSYATGMCVIVNGKEVICKCLDMFTGEYIIWPIHSLIHRSKLTLAYTERCFQALKPCHFKKSFFFFISGAFCDKRRDATSVCETTTISETTTDATTIASSAASKTPTATTPG